MFHQRIDQTSTRNASSSNEPKADFKSGPSAQNDKHNLAKQCLCIKPGRSKVLLHFSALALLVAPHIRQNKGPGPGALLPKTSHAGLSSSASLSLSVTACLFIQLELYESFPDVCHCLQGESCVSNPDSFWCP